MDCVIRSSEEQQPPAAPWVNQQVFLRKTSRLFSNDIGRRDEIDAEKLFPSRPRFSRLLFTALEPDNDSQEDGTNVLTKATFDEIWDVADKVKAWIHEWLRCFFFQSPPLLSGLPSQHG